MYDLMTSYGLEQFVNEPTRLDKVLDVIFTNKRLLLQSVVTNEPFCNSDHCMIDFVISCSNLVDNSSHKMYTKYLWRNAHNVSMSDYLTAVDWLGILTVNLTANDLWSAFTGILRTAIDLFVPTKLYEIDPNKLPSKHKHYPNRMSATTGQSH